MPGNNQTIMLRRYAESVLHRIENIESDEAELDRDFAYDRAVDAIVNAEKVLWEIHLSLMQKARSTR